MEIIARLVDTQEGNELRTGGREAYRHKTKPPRRSEAAVVVIISDGNLIDYFFSLMVA